MSDKTPEEGEWVLLASENGITQEVGKMMYQRGVAYWDTGKSRVYTFKVFRHWMPLPEPPSNEETSK